MRRDWRDEILKSGLTQEKTSLLSGVSAGRLSQICRGLVEATPDEVVRLEEVLRRARTDSRPDLRARLTEVTGIHVRPGIGLGTSDLMILNLLLKILEELQEAHKSKSGTEEQTVDAEL